MKLLFYRGILTALFLSLVSLSSLAQNKRGTIDADYQPEVITLQTTGEFESFKVTVRGHDVMFTTQFSGDEMPFLDLVDTEGNILPDGLYTYEVIAAPVLGEDLREAMAMAKNDQQRARINAAAQERGTTKSGSFSILNGEFVMPGQREQSFSASKEFSRNNDNSTPAVDADAGRDVVYNDDVIVDGSLCVGFDCVNGESFGFDTIRLKENNLRIKFMDTSVGSFPSTDWQLTANDSASGGKNKFSIDDITGGRTPFTVEGNAPSHSLYVDDGGRLGLGTSIPVVDVHVVSGNTPTLRLEQNTSSGFAAQTWDVAGNETSFFIRDASNGSTLPFRIFPSAPNSALVIGNTGNVGIGGDNTPDAALDINAGDLLVNNGNITVNNTSGDPTITIEGVDANLAITDTTGSGSAIPMTLTNQGSVSFRMSNTGVGGVNWDIGNNASAGFFASDSSTGVREMTLDSSGNMEIQGMLTEMSSRFEKENFTPVDNQDVLDRLMTLPITTWNYIDTKGVEHLGVMAQDFHAAFGLGKSDCGLSTLDTTGVAMASIQALQANSQAKDAEIERLNKQLADQAARLEKLEALLLNNN
jgi:hypothetical protein